MFCEKCGAQIDENSLFCEKCGAQCSPEPSNASPCDESVQPVTAPAAVPKARKKMGVKEKIIIVACLIAAVACVSVYSVLSSLSKPEKVAEKVFNSISELDFETLYGYMEIPEGEFLTKDMFTAANNLSYESDTANARKVSNYKIKPASSSNSMLTKDFEVEYTLQGSSEIHYMELSLIKSGKKFLFFDDYRISSDEFISNNIIIYVPASINVTVNDVPLTNPETETSYGVEYAEYTIPQMFKGSYTIKLTSDFTKERTETLSVRDDRDGAEYVYDYEPSDTFVEKIHTQCNDFLSAYFKAVDDESDFSVLQQYISSDSDYIEDYYQRELNSYYNGYRVLDSISFTSEILKEEFDIDECTVIVTVSVQTVSRQNPASGMPENNEPMPAEYTEKLGICFVNENGQWLVDRIGNIYY